MLGGRKALRGAVKIMGRMKKKSLTVKSDENKMVGIL